MFSIDFLPFSKLRSIQILYGELNLPVQRTPFGRICLKKSYLNVLADLHPLPKLITEYRRVQSALDRCIDPLEEVSFLFSPALYWMIVFVCRSSRSMNRSNHNRYNEVDVKLPGNMIVYIFNVIFSPVRDE